MATTHRVHKMRSLEKWKKILAALKGINYLNNLQMGCSECGYCNDFQNIRLN